MASCLAKDYPFVDGNKRVAFLAVGLHLLIELQSRVAVSHYVGKRTDLTVLSYYASPSGTRHQLLDACESQDGQTLGPMGHDNQHHCQGI